MKLDGRVALITGGSSGMGRASAVLFAREGAAVCVTARGEDRGRAVADEIVADGGRAIFVPSDVSRAEDCRRAVARTLEELGGLDILFNNAGYWRTNNILDCCEEEWDRSIDVNLKGTYLMTRAALPTMLEQGSGVIINNASGWGLNGGHDAVAYCAAKGGVVLLTKALAVDHSAQGVRCNCLCPGDVDTPMLRQDAVDHGLSWEEYLKGSADRPMGRIGTPEELARAALFLASDDSSFMTGATLVVDGGLDAR